MAHCAALRSGGQLRVGALQMEAMEVASKGPSIQGMGVRSQTKSNAAPRARARVATLRRRMAGMGSGERLVSMHALSLRRRGADACRLRRIGATVAGPR